MRGPLRPEVPLTQEMYHELMGGILARLALRRATAEIAAEALRERPKVAERQTLKAISLSRTLRHKKPQ